MSAPRTANPREPIESNDPRYVPDESIGDLVGEVASDIGALLHTELELAKVELREEAQRLGRAAGMLGGAALLGWFAAILLSFAASWGLGELLDSPALGFLIIGVIYAVLTAILFIQG